MVNEYVTITFVLKDGSVYELEREAYFGFIFAEGFTLKDSLKIKADKVYYNRYRDRKDFDTSEMLIRFIVEDVLIIEEDEDVKENESYQLLTEKIKKIADIKEIRTHFTFVDYDEDIYEEKEEKISFARFKADY